MSHNNDPEFTNNLDWCDSLYDEGSRNTTAPIIQLNTIHNSKEERKCPQ